MFKNSIPSLNGKVLLNIVAVGATSLVTSGCGYPLWINPQGNTLHINYEKILRSLECKIVDAYEIDYDYHKRRLPGSQPPDDTDFPGKGVQWSVKIDLNQIRHGDAALSATKTKTVAVSNWSKALTGVVNPSDSNDYTLVSNNKLSVPDNVYTQHAIRSNAEDSAELRLGRVSASECTNESYINLGQLGIVPQFENFIKSFKSESTAHTTKYTDLKFNSNSFISLSTNKNFTYTLAPIKKILIPSANYKDTITIDILVERSKYVLKEFRKKPDPPNFIVANENPIPVRGTLEVGGIVGISGGNVQIGNARELACHLHYVENIDKVKACLIAGTDADKKAFGLRNTEATKKSSNFAIKAKQIEQRISRERAIRPVRSREELITEPTGLKPDFGREGRDERIRDSLERILDE